MPPLHPNLLMELGLTAGWNLNPEDAAAFAAAQQQVAVEAMREAQGGAGNPAGGAANPPMGNAPPPGGEAANPPPQPARPHQD